MALATACACVIVNTASARGALLFVDGACAGASGTGTSIVCGPSGPFATISDGIAAMVPGDVLAIRGAHDGFDGVYVEELFLTGTGQGPLPGKALACTAAQPCVLQGCRAPVCPSDEQPVIRGMALRNDWVPQGGGVYSRTMEATPDPDDLERDEFDPHMLMEGSETPLTTLAYAGDDVLAPADGEWSYHPTTHALVVNPIGDGDPADEVFVPHFSFNAHIEDPSANVTLEHLTLEGSRGRSILASGEPGVPVPGLVFRHLVQRYIPRHFIVTAHAPGVLIEDSLAEYGCRGLSWALGGADGCFGYRLFGAHDCMVRRNILRHLGATGRRKLSGGFSGWPCSWCDPPWNDPSHTDVSTFGVGINIKQTDGGAVEDNRCEDLSHGAIFLDVSRRVVVQRNTLERTRAAIGMVNFTPTVGCPTTSPTRFCYNSDHVIRDNVVDESGLQNVNDCAVSIEAGSERHDGAVFSAQIYNNMISHPGFGGICVQSDSATPTLDLLIAHNTVYGARTAPEAQASRGLVIRDATQNVVVRNNLFDGLASDALLLTSAALPGLSLDGDVVGSVAQCEVRWDVPPFGDTPSGGTCDTLAGFAAAATPQEAHGRTGAMQFADVATVPPDLHLTAASAAIDAGVAVGITTDIDDDVRPMGAGWDAGADEVADGTPTSSTITPSTTTSSLGPSTTVPPSSTSSTIRVTSTTLPAPRDAHRLRGASLLLTDGGKPEKRRFRVVSTDKKDLVLGEGVDVPGLISRDGDLRLVAVGGDAFAERYPLHAANWQLIDPRHPAKGARYRSEGGPVTKVRFEVGKRLAMQGKGSQLGQSLAREPTLVKVELRVGSEVYCLAFGGLRRRFESQRKLLRAKAPRPATCLTQRSVSAVVDLLGASGR